MNDRVKFLSNVDARGPKAKSLVKTSDNSTQNHENILLIRKIESEWRQEGLQESNAKLFYYMDEIDQVVSGSKCFVIGRKGTGKTAIAEYLFQQNSFENYTEKLSFKSFPIHDLYEKKDTSFSLQNQYITIWKHIIYGSVLKMMSLNENIDSSLLKNLRKLFPLDPIDRIERKVKSLTELELSISIAGNSLKRVSKQRETEPQSAIEKAQLFEDVIVSYIDRSKYFIIIDALDDDYSDITRKEQYFYLLNGLFKAVQEIKAIFPIQKYSIFPIVFLRDDIYRQINDSDKAKWRDLIVRIYWNKIKIQNMLSHRIMKTIGTSANISDFFSSWKHVFISSKIKFEGKSSDIFDIIYELSYVRPRDFIVFIKLCCERAIINKTFIDENIIFKTLDSFSKYLLEDIEYEIKPIIPEINNVFSIFEQIRKREFTFSEFEEKFRASKEKGKLKTEKSAEEILDELYEFSFIGNLTDRDIKIYKLYSPTSSLNFDERIIIKNGLQLALRL